jgi:ABC-type branched-subunit amino acid transport system ATPase component
MKSIELKLINVTKIFNELKALNNICCEFHNNRIYGIIGPNGAGKTTLLNIISGYLILESGDIEMTILTNNNEKNIHRISKLQPYEIVNLGISRNFQEVRIIDNLSVFDHIMLYIRNHQYSRVLDCYKSQRARKIYEEKLYRNVIVNIARDLELHDLIFKSASMLSYGQQKLLNILCCLAADPYILLLDEPLSGIAPEMIKHVLYVIQEFSKNNRIVIIIEHNVNAISKVCNKLIFIDAGKIVSEGSPKAVLNDPKVIESYLS